jgi:hypothetical protein
MNILKLILFVLRGACEVLLVSLLSSESFLYPTVPAKEKK